MSGPKLAHDPCAVVVRAGKTRFVLVNDEHAYTVEQARALRDALASCLARFDRAVDMADKEAEVVP